MDNQGDLLNIRKVKEAWEKGPLEAELKGTGEREKEFKTVS